MSHHDQQQSHSTERHYEAEPVTADEKADAMAALAIIAVGILTAIHFIYTGGLPAFLSNVL